MIFWIVAGLILLFGFVVAFGAPYVPSLRGEVRHAFEDLYPISKKDFVVDLGSGDGVVLAEAAKRGAKGLGYEINPVLVLISSLRLRGKARISMKSMWSADLPPQTTLVYAFTVTRDSKRLGRYLQRQANEQARTIKVMTFGSMIKGFRPVQVLKAHSLYEISPQDSTLQS